MFDADFILGLGRFRKVERVQSVFDEDAEMLPSVRDTTWKQ